LENRLNIIEKNINFNANHSFLMTKNNISSSVEIIRETLEALAIINYNKLPDKELFLKKVVPLLPRIYFEPLFYLERTIYFMYEE